MDQRERHSQVKHDSHATPTKPDRQSTPKEPERQPSPGKPAGQSHWQIPSIVIEKRKQQQQPAHIGEPVEGIPAGLKVEKPKKEK